MVEQASGQFVSYEPPPLLGQSSVQRDGTGTKAGADLVGTRGTIGQPIVPRRARYAGSRMLRLGHPASNNNYPLNARQSS